MKSETEILMGIIIFLAVLGFVSAFLPAELQILSTFDFAFLGGSIVGISAACALVTGIPCAIALGIFGVANVLLAVIPANILNSVFTITVSNSTFQFIKPLILVPITLIISYIIGRLAKGGG